MVYGFSNNTPGVPNLDGSNSLTIKSQKQFTNTNNTPSLDNIKKEKERIH